MVVLIVGREFAVSGLRSIAAAEGYTIKASDLGKTKMIAQVVAISCLLLSIRHPESGAARQLADVGRGGLRHRLGASTISANSGASWTCASRSGGAENYCVWRGGRGVRSSALSVRAAREWAVSAARSESRPGSAPRCGPGLCGPIGPIGFPFRLISRPPAFPISSRTFAEALPPSWFVRL